VLLHCRDPSGLDKQDRRPALAVAYHVKNVVKIAHAPATKKNTRVPDSHLLQALKARESFTREFNGTSVVESVYH